MKELGRHIELINSSKTPEEAFDRFVSIMKNHGYDRVTYSLVTDHPSLKLQRRHGLATSYPEDWMKLYNEKNYMEIDPVTKRCLSSRKPFFWSDVTDGPELAKSSLQLMREAEDAGLADGIGISLLGQPGELVGIGLAKSASHDGKTKDYNFFAGAYLLSVYFHETFRDLLSNPFKVELTKREKEILNWASEGKRDEEIADIFKTLEAHGRIYAITKAIRLQLITPSLVRTPYQKW